VSSQATSTVYAYCHLSKLNELAKNDRIVIELPHLNCLHLMRQQLHGTNSIAFYAAKAAVILSLAAADAILSFSRATAVVVFLYGTATDAITAAINAVAIFSSSS
jgi:hypothetical protein